MAELLVRGAGRLPQVRDGAMLRRCVDRASPPEVAAHVARRTRCRGISILCSPGWSVLRWDPAHQGGQVLVRDLADPIGCPVSASRVCDGSSLAGVMLQRRKAAQLLEAAKVALRLPGAEPAPVRRVACRGRGLLDAIGAEIGDADDASPRCSSDTCWCPPLLAGVGVVRASAYGAAIGIRRGSRTPAPPTVPRPGPGGVLLRGSPPRRSTHQPGRIRRPALSDHRAWSRPRWPRRRLRRLPAAVAQQRQATSCRRGQRLGAPTAAQGWRATPVTSPTWASTMTTSPRCGRRPTSCRSSPSTRRSGASAGSGPACARSTPRRRRRSRSTPTTTSSTASGARPRATSSPSSWRRKRSTSPARSSGWPPRPASACATPTATRARAARSGPATSRPWPGRSSGTTSGCCRAPTPAPPGPTCGPVASTATWCASSASAGRPTAGTS